MKRITSLPVLFCLFLSIAFISTTEFPSLQQIDEAQKSVTEMLISPEDSQTLKEFEKENKVN